MLLIKNMSCHVHVYLICLGTSGTIEGIENFQTCIKRGATRDERWVTFRKLSGITATDIQRQCRFDNQW